jgi:gamma-glutamyltranspeptidase
MTLDDLATFRSEEVEPISTTYHGYNGFELPPPGQGFAALEMLNILDVCIPNLGLSLAALGPSNPMYWHLIVEAKKIAYSIDGGGVGGYQGILFMRDPRLPEPSSDPMSRGPVKRPVSRGVRPPQRR